MEKLLTLETNVGHYKIMCTQTYNKEFDSGHFKYVIIEGGHIIYQGGSIRSSLKGKITKTGIKKIVHDCLRWDVRK